MFRESVQCWTEQKSAPVPPNAAVLRACSAATFPGLKFSLAAAALLLAMIIPLHWRIPDAELKANRVEDTLLLEQVHAQLSRDVPAPMQPLMNMIFDPASLKDGRDR